MTALFTKPDILDSLGNTHCVVEASAGTGKTYIIEHIVIDLITQGIPLDKILLVTFTTKATLELKTRIKNKLETIANHLKDSNCLEQTPTNKAGWELDTTKRLLLKIALANVDKLNIHTIHGFCQQVLSETVFESGNLLQQTLAVNNNLFLKTFKDLIRTRFTKNTSERLILTKAITSMGGVEKLGKLLEDALIEYTALDLPTNVSIEKVLKVFPVEIAKDLREELNSYQINSVPGPLLSTLKSANLDLRSCKAIINRLKQILNGIKFAEDNNNPGLFWSEVVPTDFYYLSDKLHQCITQATNKNSIKPIIELWASCNILIANAFDFKAIIVATLLPTIKEELERVKKKEGIFDFNDMIALVHKAIKSGNGEQLLKHLQERFQIAIIDEFQDTDKLQWDIFSDIFLNNQHRLILVGDPKQAIYGFRNGDLPTYLSATKKVIANTKQAKATLAINFRSTQDLITLQNKIFNQSNQKPFFTGKNSTLFSDISCGQPKLTICNENDQILPALLLMEVNAKNDLEIKQQAAKCLATVIQNTLSTTKFEGKQINPEQIMVLTYSAKEGVEIANALKAIKVPYTLFKQEGLFTTTEAVALKDLFLAIDNPINDSLRAKALLGPFFNLSFQEIEICRQNPEEHYVVKLLLSWQQLIHDRCYGDFFSKLIADSCVTQNQDNVSIANITQILELLHREALARFHTLTDLAYKLQCWFEGINWPDVENVNTKKLEALTGAVQILTIHKAKGLEAPIVAIYGGFSTSNSKANVHRYYNDHNERKIWIGSLKLAPKTIQNLINTERDEEYQRLWYVALTRAKAQLIMPKITSNSYIQEDSDLDKAIKNKGPYECINKQLLLLPNESTTVVYSNNYKLEQNSAQRQSKPLDDLTLMPMEDLFPNFTDLAKKSYPMCRFSYTSLHNYFHKIPMQKNLLAKKSALENSYNSQHNSINRISSSRIGTLVHELLQLVPLDTFTDKSMTEWLNTPSITKLFNERVPPVLYNLVTTWIYQAITNPLPTLDGDIIIIYQSQNIMREMTFTIPYPGYSDMLNGSIDMILQWRNRIYILDWKTNQLNDYSQNTLKDIIVEHYLLQIKIYTIAVCRFFKITSKESFDNYFGEFIYVFLRGLPHQGTCTIKPSWSNIQDWESEIKNLPIH